MAEPLTPDAMLLQPHRCSPLLPLTLRRLAVVPALAWLVAAPLGAQTAEQRRALESFRDSLTTITDSTTLRLVELRLLAAAERARVDAFGHLRLGHLALRQGELGGVSHYDDAASEFQWASDLAPSWPYAWYGLGLAEYALGTRARGAAGRQPVLARDAWSRATRAFAEAALLEPAFAARLETLARRALRDRAPEEAAIVREALRRATQEGRGPRLARLFLALGRVQRATGDSGASASFQAYLDSGEGRALALVELGRTRLLAGDVGGAALYMEGAGGDDALATAAVRADLEPIATEGELADFDLRRGDARQDMLRRFWGSRDRLEFRREGERLAEHLRRLETARRDFLLAEGDSAGRLDDRGRVYVRHGEPDDRASFTQAGIEPNESWRYHWGAREIVLHFVARQAPNDFRLVESMLDVSDVRGHWADGPSASSDAATVADAAQLLRSRAALSTLYQRGPAGNAGRAADFVARERRMGREAIRIGTLTDSYTLRFPRELKAWGSVVVAGGSGAEPAVQVLFAIPGYAIAPATGAVGIVYPVRVRFVALDSTGTVVASVDSLLRLEPGSPIAPNRSLVGRLAIPIRPGRVVAQAAVLYGEGAGTAFGVDTVMVPSPGGDALALGDILIGSPQGRISIPLGEGLSLPLAPGGLASRSDGADLVVEIFGLAPGGSASLRVMVAPGGDQGGGGGAEGWRPFPGLPTDIRQVRGPGQGPIVRSRVTLPLRKLKPGSWSVAVVVADGTGRTARREGSLVVLEP